MDIGNLKDLAARGVREARLLLSMMQGQAKQQDQNDRRWRNMSAYMDRLKAEGKSPKTGQDHLDAFKHCGYVPNYPLSKQQLARHMEFHEFMQACGGFRDLEDYPLKAEPDAPAKCEGCRQLGAGMRCSWCGEWYCSLQCFKKDMRSHLPTCQAAAENIYCSGAPAGKPDLWTAQNYATTFGLPPSRAAPTAAAAGSSAALSRTGAAAAAVLSMFSAVHGMLQEPAPLTKGQKKNAKKNQKKAAARAAAVVAVVDGVDDDNEEEEGEEGHGVDGSLAARQQ